MYNKTEKVLTMEQEKALFELYNNGSEDAKNIIFEHNIGLVQEIANYYAQQTKFLDYDDLFQEGYLALMKALKHFDYSLGYRFSTYATKCIFRTINYVVKNTENTIRLTDAARKQKVEINYIPLDDFIEEEEEFYMKVTSVSEKTEKEEKEIELFFLREQFRKILTTLTSKEVKVLSLRFGLDGLEPHDLESVAKEFSVTRERIRQIEAKALRKLRHPSRGKQLKYWL